MTSFFVSEEVPFPLEKTRFVIRKITEKDPARNSSQDRDVPIDFPAESVATNDSFCPVFYCQSLNSAEFSGVMCDKNALFSHDDGMRS